MVLPLSLDDLSPEWLTEALSSVSPGTVVDDVVVDSVIWGTATKAFLKVSYRERADDGPPEALCIKGCFQQDMRPLAGLGCRLEAAFYRDLAPAIGTTMLRTWYADFDEATNQGVVITDDLRAAEVSFGQAGMAYSVDEVAAGLELQAAWHGRTWDRSGPASAPWLTVGSSFFRHAMENFLMQPEHWAKFLQLPQTDALVDGLENRERMIRAVRWRWQLDDAGVLCLNHGDAHIGNTYRVAGEAAPRFLDWQVFSLGPWADDVAYFMVGSLNIEDRRQHEEELVRHYLKALAATGAPAPSFDEAMQTLRGHHLHGVLWAMCPPEMQDPADVAEMAGRHAQAALDHGTLAVLEAGC
jgi:hypothetical protein